MTSFSPPTPHLLNRHIHQKPKDRRQCKATYWSEARKMKKALERHNLGRSKESTQILILELTPLNQQWGHTHLPACLGQRVKYKEATGMGRLQKKATPKPGGVAGNREGNQHNPAALPWLKTEERFWRHRLPTWHTHKDDGKTKVGRKEEAWKTNHEQ